MNERNHSDEKIKDLLESGYQNFDDTFGHITESDRPWDRLASFCYGAFEGGCYNNATKADYARAKELAEEMAG